MSYAYATQDEKTISGAMALVMHLLFLLLLVFGVSWQHKQSDSAVIVDLWNNLPALPQPKAEPPPPEAKAPPEPPKPVPKAEPKPKPEPKPVIKPDIALKEKLEKERKLKVEQEKLEEKKREQEKARVALKEKRAKEVEAKQLAKEQDDALRKINEMQAAQAAARGKQIDEYRRRISEKVKRFIVLPPNLQGNPEVEFDVVLLPGGEVLGVKLRKSSAVTAYDNAVERAILKAQPLPLPPDPALFNDFRELKLKFRPKE
ncbi:MAG: cell envelope integrity protein TolA [Burkholderiales bacterium]|nr:cell envelope integrity protein TolA [Burkholderiales bacterium]